jgi:GR25 family glycosyltransferase involved in LPS biosynthesis
MNLTKYYINLEKSEDRRNSIKVNFPEAIRIEAYDGFKLGKYKDFILPKKTVSTSTELACTLSHLKAIKYAYSNNLEEVLIIEDDLLNPYESKWSKTLEEIIENRPEESNCIIFNSNNPLVYDEKKEYIKWKQGHWGTACYWLNKTSIKIIFDKYINKDLIIDMNNHETSLYHEADMGIIYGLLNAYNYTKPLFKFLDGKNLIRDDYRIQDSLINKLCDEKYKN